MDLLAHNLPTWAKCKIESVIRLHRKQVEPDFLCARAPVTQLNNTVFIFKHDSSFVVK